jgi:ribose 5-phosphate isomerase A
VTVDPATLSPQDRAKHAAATAALALVEDGMRLGLGTGSTAWFVVEALAARVRDEGLRITCVATSVATEQHAAARGLTLAGLADLPTLDLAIDGADEVERGTLRLTKGLGGALLREKMVAQAARRFVIVADPGKVVDRLNSRAALPVEVVPFAHAATARRLPGHAALRMNHGAPFFTDNGNVIYDCTALEAPPEAVEALLDRIAGVVEHGFFLSGVERAIIGKEDGSAEVLFPAAP